MKTNIIKNVMLSLGCIFCFSVLWSQSPAGISYQAVVRDAGNKLLCNQTIGMQVSILQGDIGGTAVFREAHITSTNASGLLTIEIGSGTNLTGGLSVIDWGYGPYYIKTEIDPEGGTDYSLTATSQLLSVPYAMHAQTAQSLSGDLPEEDPVFQAWDRSTGVLISESQVRDLKNYIETESDPLYTSSPAWGITQDDISGWNNKPDSYSETDPVFAAWDKSGGITITESQVSDLGNYLERETDPVYRATAAAGITSGDITNWNNKLGSFTETDPVFAAWNKSSGISITENQVSNLGNYIETETDPVFGSSPASAITAADTANWNHKLDDYTESQNLADVLAQNNSAGNQTITNVADPVNEQDAATKAYVETLLAKIEAAEDLFSSIVESSDDFYLLTNGFTDPRDGNHYRVVKIGEQIWMAENLKYLPNVMGIGTSSATIAHYYVYDYNGTNVAEAKTTANYATYGVLYNWPAAMNGCSSSTANPSGVQGICPPGWHLPSDAEWEELNDFFEGSPNSGDKLKEAGTTHWPSPNTGATNETGFTGLPGGVYYPYYNSFMGIGKHGYWWSASSYSNTTVWVRNLSYFFSKLNKPAPQEYENGISVRCLRD